MEVRPLLNPPPLQNTTLRGQTIACSDPLFLAWLRPLCKAKETLTYTFTALGAYRLKLHLLTRIQKRQTYLLKAVLYALTLGTLRYMHALYRFAAYCCHHANTASHRTALL